MSESRKVLLRTVYHNEESGEFCSCEGDFWKTCSLRVVNSLPCAECLISITTVERDSADPAADNSVRSLEKQFDRLTNNLKMLHGRLKIR